jgi:conjugative transfer signal peptidase TraF
MNLPSKLVSSFKKLTLLALISLTLLTLSFKLLGLYINTTRSIPLGLYKSVNQKPRKGAYVIFCPPKNEIFDIAMERGYIGVGLCVGGYGYMMKQVVALEKDKFLVSADGVSVNDTLLPFSQPLLTDGLGRKLPQINQEKAEIPKNYLLLMSDSPNSFDGRYFGLINKKQVKSVIKPLYTW